MKLTAIMSGSDWYDASVHHLEIPEDMNLKQLYKEHLNWIRTVYYVDGGINPEVKYRNFTQFLLQKGALEANIEEFWET